VVGDTRYQIIEGRLAMIEDRIAFYGALAGVDQAMLEPDRKAAEMLRWVLRLDNPDLPESNPILVGRSEQTGRSER
jgi:hypothetical protein